MLSFLNQPALSFPFSGRDSWAVAGSLFFFSTTGGSDQEPNFWTSDGTTAGTLPILLAESPASSIVPNLDFLRGEHSFAAHGGRFVFEVRLSGFDELWTSDATPAGTTALEGPILGGGQISDLTPLLPGGPLFFRNQGALYQTDGTPAGTGPTLPFPVSLSSREITAVGSSVFFSCNDPDSTSGWELCRSNGTPAGTGLVKEIRPGTDGSLPEQLTASGGALYFNADDGTAGRELWTSDGTEAGTTLVRDLWIGGDSSPDRLIDVAGTLFFSATTPDEGRELWKTDGTEAGTVLVKDIRPGSDSSIEKASHWGGFTVAVGGTLFFVANDGASGTELWKSDGTAAGTVLVKDIAPGSLGSGPFWLTRVSNRVYFAADNGVHGRELWVTDGTAAGTRMVEDIYPGSRSSTPQNFQAVGHVLVFAATDGVHGLEAWRSNGVAAGTRMLQDIAPEALPSSPAGFTPAGSHVFFAANDAATGMEPWAIPRAAVLATFSDVPPSYWAYPFIEALASQAITSGCGGGNYCPESTVTRAQMAVFILVGAHGPSYSPPPATGQVFADVPADSFAASWIEQLAAEGYTAGCGNGSFCPAKSISRAEAAVFLLLLGHGVGYAPPPATGLVFTDVPISSPFAPWIEQLSHEGITGGCGGGKYCPNNPVTRAQIAVFLSAALNLPLGLN
jgi:ELWxxDGT repeat protein